MEILHLVGRSHRRGAEQVAMELAEELDALGHGNRLVAVGLGHDGGRIEALPPLLEARRQAAPEVLRAALGLRRDLRRAPVDVVLAHGATAVLVAVLASPRRGPALVWQTILALVESSFHGVRGVCWRVAVRRVDAVVALTEELGEEARRLGFGGPVVRIPNGRRTGRFADLDRAASGRALRSELDLGPEVGLVGLVGYLVDQKRPERAVEVLAALRRSGRDAHLVVVGSGPLAGAVADRVATLGLTGHVSLLGHRDDVPEILAGLDVLVLTSADEGIPGVVVEAAMAGCPVVTHAVGGVAEVVTDQVTGVVVDDPAPQAVAAAVGGLLADDERRAEMSERARQRSGEFSLEAMAARYEDLLRTATAGGRT